MANDYLVRLHRYITEQLEAARHRNAIAGQSGDTTASAHYRGRIDALLATREFLSKQFDLNHHRYY